MVSRIQAIHFNADAKLVGFIEHKLNELDHYIKNVKINSADVILKLENSGSIKEKVVELVVNLSGIPLIIKTTGKKFEEAFRKAYSQLKRQILRYKEIKQNKH